MADPLIEFIGEIGDSEKSAFLGNASALLFPIDWPEPFGLVLIEAMAMWNACDRVALRVRLRSLTTAAAGLGFLFGATWRR